MDLLKYFGLDFVAMGLSLLAILLLGRKNRWGFVVFAVANAIWLSLGATLIESWGIVIGTVFFLLTNARGFYKWSRSDEASKPVKKSAAHPRKGRKAPSFR